MMQKGIVPIYFCIDFAALAQIFRRFIFRTTLAWLIPSARDALRVEPKASIALRMSLRSTPSRVA